MITPFPSTWVWRAVHTRIEKQDIHGIQGGTPPLVDSGMARLQDATFAEAPVPAFLVKIDAGRVDGIEGTRITYVELVGSNANNGASTLR